MTIYSFVDTIPLSFSRVRAGGTVTGLTVTVSVQNVKTGATLLASTAVPEVGSATGIYTYNWTHGITVDTQCLVTFLVGGSKYVEFILITNDGNGGRAV